MKIWKGFRAGMSENMDSGLLLKNTFAPEGHIQPIKIHELIQMLIRKLLLKGLDSRPPRIIAFVRSIVSIVNSYDSSQLFSLFSPKLVFVSFSYSAPPCLFPFSCLPVST